MGAVQVAPCPSLALAAHAPRSTRGLSKDQYNECDGSNGRTSAPAPRGMRIPGGRQRPPLALADTVQRKLPLSSLRHRKRAYPGWGEPGQIITRSDAHGGPRIRLTGPRLTSSLAFAQLDARRHSCERDATGFVDRPLSHRTLGRVRRQRPHPAADILDTSRRITYLKRQLSTRPPYPWPCDRVVRTETRPELAGCSRLRIKSVHEPSRSRYQYAHLVRQTSMNLELELG